MTFLIPMIQNRITGDCEKPQSLSFPAMTVKV